MLIDGISMLGTGSVSGVNFEKTLTFPGTLTVATGLPRWHINRNTLIVNIHIDAHVGPAGSSAKFNVNKNGEFWFTAELPDAADHVTVPVGLSALPNDYVTVDIARVGSSIPGEYVTFTLEYEFIEQGN